MRNILITVISILAISLSSCMPKGHSVEISDTENDRWSTVEEFYYDNVDTLTRRDISIVVRYGHGYTADSVAMSILSISPDSMVFEEPFTLRIPRLGDMRPAEHTFLYRRNVLLYKEGRYTFRLKPDAVVEGISSVGLVISEVNRGEANSQQKPINE